MTIAIILLIIKGQPGMTIVTILLIIKGQPGMTIAGIVSSCLDMYAACRPD